MEFAIALLILVALGFLFTGGSGCDRKPRRRPVSSSSGKATVRAKAPWGAHTA